MVNDDFVRVPRDLLADLWRYGNIHAVSGVIYGKPHSERLKEADAILAASPSPTPSGEVGELARLLNAAADDFEQEAEGALEFGDRSDLWDQVVEVPLKDARTAASLLLALDAERGRLRASRNEVIEMCAAVADVIAKDPKADDGHDGVGAWIADEIRKLKDTPNG